MVRPALQGDLFASAAPAGLRYRPDLITPGEEVALIEALSGLPLSPFAFHGHLGHRRVVSFGWRYDYAARRIAEEEHLPAFLAPLRQRAGDFVGVPAEAFEQALVTEYAPGAGIGWHRDKAEFGLVAGVSLAAPCVLRFRRRSGAGWERTVVNLAPRSIYLLDGPARRDWEHSIVPMEMLRYSVTFRTRAAAGVGIN